MDKATKKLLQVSLKVANSIMATFGLTILLYSVVLFVVNAVRHDPEYLLSWFIWASLGVGVVFCLASGIGYVAAFTKSGVVLSAYIFIMFWLLLMESLLTTDVMLHKKWEKDFPEDNTDRFDDFVDFVKSKSIIFKILGWFLLISQVISFSVAVALKILGIKLRSYIDDRDHLQAYLPFLNHHTDQHYTAVGYPHPAPNCNVVHPNTTRVLERETCFNWLMAADVWAPCHI